MGFGALMALISISACTNRVGGDCAHVNDIRPIAPPAHVAGQSAIGGQGTPLTATAVYRLSSIDAPMITVLWRSCPVLNSLRAAETASSITVHIEVSGCPAQPARDTTTTSEEVWYAGTAPLQARIGARAVLDDTPVFCDTVAT